MKKMFFVLFCFWVPISVFSQKDSIVNYLDRRYKKVKKEQATYIQTIVKKDSLWLGTVYFANGKMKLQGNFEKRNLKTRTGLFKIFNDSGNLKSIQEYNSKGKKEGVYYYFNDQGEGITKGYFLKGNREGVWEYKDDAKNDRARIVYKKGKVLSYNLWNEDGKVLTEDLVVLRAPAYKDGEEKFKIKLKNELISDLKNEGLKTNFLLKCHIDVNGRIQDISVSPKIDANFEEKIINYFKNLEGIQPGIIANMKVKYPIEIPFILN